MYYELNKEEYYFFLRPATTSFKVLPGVNLGDFLAAILIGAFVCGLIPLRAFRSLTLKLPNPVSVISPPFFSSAVIVSRVASNTSPESFLVIPALDAMASISPDLDNDMVIKIKKYLPMIIISDILNKCNSKAIKLA